MIDTTEQIEQPTAKRQRLRGVLLRVPEELHEALRRAAYEQHTSINKLASAELVKMTSTMFAQEAV